MPRNHKPLKVSQAITRRSGSGKYSAPGNSHPGNGHLCPKSPTGSHWWQIAFPDGEISVGMCRYCGEQRQFANTLEVAVRLRGK